MGPFRCRTCGQSSDQAAECHVCGARTFVLSREARVGVPALGGPQRRGNLVPISEAPSLRRRRRRWAY